MRATATIPRVLSLAALAVSMACAGKASAPVETPTAPALAAPPSPTPAPTPEEAIGPRVTPDADFRARLPAAAAERPFQVPRVQRFRLKNGLAIILAESHKLPLVSVELVIKTGGAANPPARAGLASLTANLLDEGTTTRSALEIADQISFLGASLATYAGWDASSVAVSSLAEHLDAALEIWADVLLHPAFADAELARVRDNLIASLLREKDSPPALANAALARALYGETHPFGWNDRGVETSLRGLGAADLRAFHEAYYRPNNAVLVAAGAVTAAELRAKLERLLGAWKSKPVAAPPLPSPPAPARPIVYLIDKAGAPQSSIRVGRIGIPRKTPDYHRALVMNHILGGSFKRLFMNLREAKGWTYGVRSSFQARRVPGPWFAGGEFVAVHTVDAVKEILREMQDMRDADVTDKELAETKAELIRAFPASFATTGQIASQMATLAVYDLPLAELEQFARKIAAISKADVRKAARDHLRPDRVAIVVVGDRKSHEAGLRALGEVRVLDADLATVEVLTP